MFESASGATARKLTRSSPAGAAGVFGRQPGGSKRALRCRAARSPGHPRRGSEERRNGELRARNGRSLGVPVFCEMVAEVGKRRWAQEVVLGRG